MVCSAEVCKLVGGEGELDVGERSEGGLRERFKGESCEETTARGTAGKGKGRPDWAVSRVFVTSFRGVPVSSTVESSVSSSMPSSSHQTSSQPEAGDPPTSQSVFLLKKAKIEDSEEGRGKR